MPNRHKRDGFALPLVLISSVVMMIVLVGSLTSVTSVSTLIKEQYYDKITKEAAESGIMMANACLTLNANAVTWTNAKPLKPNTDCAGTAISGASLYVLDTQNPTSVGTQNLKTDFSVPAPAVSGGVQSLISTGTLYQYKTSGSGTPTQSSTTLTEAHYTSARKSVIY